jgi:hypothetical protein
MTTIERRRIDKACHTQVVVALVPCVSELLAWNEHVK